MLKEHRGSEGRIERLAELLKALEEVSFFRTEFPIRAKEGNFLVQDSEETSYLLKWWKEGRECDPRSELDVCRSMEGLAIFHERSRNIWQFEDVVQREKFEGTDLAQEMEKRTKELKKVQTFIRKKRKKSEFESAYLEILPKFLPQAEQMTGQMKESAYEDLQKQAFDVGQICHGEYMQHNVLFDRSKLILTNFEHAHLDLTLVDISLFLRKIMEKQGWRISAGEKYLRAYEIVRPLCEEERKILGLTLSYPEKLWKLANHYYHSNKAWIPAKNLEKLKLFVGQQKERERFVNRVLL